MLCEEFMSKLDRVSTLAAGSWEDQPGQVRVGTVSEVIGLVPQIAPKKHVASEIMARWKGVPRKTDVAMPHIVPAP